MSILSFGKLMKFIIANFGKQYCVLSTDLST